MSLVFYPMTTQMEIGQCTFVNGIRRQTLHVQLRLEQETVFLV
jgi:hypothetical protein